VLIPLGPRRGNQLVQCFELPINHGQCGFNVLLAAYSVSRTETGEELFGPLQATNDFLAELRKRRRQ